MQNNFSVISPFNNQEYYHFSYTCLTEVKEKVCILTSRSEKHSTKDKLYCLERLIKLIERDSKELANIIVNEIGKTLTDAMVEIERAQVTINAIRDARAALSGDLLESQSYIPGENKFGLVTYAPLGIVSPSLHLIFPSILLFTRLSLLWRWEIRFYLNHTLSAIKVLDI